MSYIPPFYKRIFHSTRRSIAKFWLSKMPTIQIALTGSQGKTNTTSALKYVLSQLGETVATDIDLDTIYNIPITALQVRPNTKYTIFECGVDHPGEMDAHLEIIKPHIVLITGISPVHTDREHFGSFENLIKEKRKLIEHLTEKDYAILNYDDEHVRQMGQFTKAKVIWYGTDEKKCDIWAKNISLSIKGLSFLLCMSDRFCHGSPPRQGSLHIRGSSTLSGTPPPAPPIAHNKLSTQLIGLHHIYTLMSTFAVYHILTKGENPHSFKMLISDLKPLPGRMSVEKGPLGTIILNDSLRANPSSTTAGLLSFSAIEHKEGKKYAVLGEMGELENPEEEHRKIGQLIASLPIDFLIGVGPNQKYLIESAIKHGFPTVNTSWAPNMLEAGKKLKEHIKKGDFIYLKGSLLRHMERILLVLENQRVKCSVVVCPFYHSCTSCRYLSSGYSSK